MAESPRYAIVFARQVSDHVRVIDRKYHPLIRQHIEEQLSCEPGRTTRNRKPLRQPAAIDARWELRCGPDNRFRVFYVIDEQNLEVLIVAVGVKQGSRLTIGSKEIEL